MVKVTYDCGLCHYHREYETESSWEQKSLTECPKCHCVALKKKVWGYLYKTNEECKE